MTYPFNHITIACDHGALALKNHLVSWFERHQDFSVYPLMDVGVHTQESVDYPDVAKSLVSAMRAAGQGSFGILLCGSGVGVSMAANRYVDMRAALVSEPLSAELARAHNNANILCMGGRLVGFDMAKACVSTFLTTPFDGGRHVRRVDKLGLS